MIDSHIGLVMFHFLKNEKFYSKICWIAESSQKQSLEILNEFKNRKAYFYFFGSRKTKKRKIQMSVCCYICDVLKKLMNDRNESQNVLDSLMGCGLGNICAKAEH
jgi:hypothetical protein